MNVVIENDFINKHFSEELKDQIRIDAFEIVDSDYHNLCIKSIKIKDFYSDDYTIALELYDDEHLVMETFIRLKDAIRRL